MEILSSISSINQLLEDKGAQVFDRKDYKKAFKYFNLSRKHFINLKAILPVLFILMVGTIEN
jgi:hypothetical protein